MKKGTEGFQTKRGVSGVILLLLSLFVFVSCSPTPITLCRVELKTADASRDLTAKITDPLDSLNIYYRTIYKGSGESYVNMSGSTEFKRLGNDGILVSQGLWDIEVLFSPKDEKHIDSEIKTDYFYSAAARNIFINLNTTSITVTLDNENNAGDGEGAMVIKSYSLASLPATVLPSTSLSVSLYKWDGSEFKLANGGLSLNESSNVYSSESISLESGSYYAVFKVKGTISGVTGTIFTDTIGFVVRSGLTTKISGSCNKYNTPSSSNSFNVEMPSTGTDNTNISDIRNFDGKDFQSDGTYVITQNSDYDFIAGTKEDGTPAPTEKVLSSGQNITIDMNGNSIINCKSEVSEKTTFTVNTGASLTIYNSRKTSDAQYIGWKGTAPNSAKQSSFLVNGGSFTLGSTDVSHVVSIKLKGAPTGINSSGTKSSPIEFTTNGGIINILAPGEYTDENGDKKVAYTRIVDCTKGITNLYDNSIVNKGNTMNLTINMKNSSIFAQGDANDTETGIHINGTMNTSQNYGGKISISLDGVSDEKYTIKCSNSKKSSGPDHSCLVIENYSGEIEIVLKNNAYLISKNGNGIYLKNCTGPITIRVEEGSKIEGYEGKGDGILFDNCQNITIENNGTIASGVKLTNGSSYANATN